MCTREEMGELLSKMCLVKVKATKSGYKRRTTLKLHKSASKTETGCQREICKTAAKRIGLCLIEYKDKKKNLIRSFSCRKSKQVSSAGA